MAQIAIVEDDPHIRKVLELALRPLQHEVRTFPDGSAALLELMTRPCDLVVSDVRMPRLDGISLCKALREHFHKGQLPILLISALDTEDDILRALEAGASDYIVKPFAPRVVRAKVAHLLNQASETTENLPAQSPDLPTPFGAYRLERLLGKGSTGRVYDATRRTDRLRVALKILEEDVTRDRNMLARYFREIDSLSRLQSEHIVQIVDRGYEQRRYFLAMSYTEGPTLAAELDRLGHLPVARSLRIGLGLTRALGALAAHGLVHRDLKPGNILLQRGNDHAVLVDFGLAKDRTERGLTASDEILGTAGFIAPEVLRGDQLEHPGSDVYALGVTLYECLAGVRPFAADPPYQVLAKVARGVPIPEVAQVNPRIPDDVSDLIALLMAPDPRERLSEATSIVAELQELIGRHGAS